MHVQSQDNKCVKKKINLITVFTKTSRVLWQTKLQALRVLVVTHPGIPLVRD